MAWRGERGATSLTAPGYVETAASLGGGSIGIAPFDLHGESCLPPDGSVVEALPGLTATVRHYGPVTFTAAPMTVSRRPVGTTDPFLDVTNDFVFAATAGDANSVDVSKSASGAGFVAAFDYRIEPTANLRSAGVAGEPAVASYVYTITALIGCGVADLNGDGVVDGVDLAFLLNAWGPCAGCPEDLNGDGTVDGLDLAFLLNMFGPCAPCAAIMEDGSGGPAAQSSSVPWILQELGFESVARYVRWLNALTDNELAAHIRTVIKLIQSR